jgi:hypothetical protein
MAPSASLSWPSLQASAGRQPETTTPQNWLQTRVPPLIPKSTQVSPPKSSRSHASP